MRYRNAQTSIQAPSQMIQFGTLKKKGESSLIFGKNSQNDQEIIISNIENVPLFLAATASLIHPEKSSKTKTMESIFKDFCIQNAPQQYANLQHENTLQQIVNLIKLRVNTIDEIRQFLQEYSMGQFVIKCYGRAVIKKYIENKTKEKSSNGKSNNLINSQTRALKKDQNSQIQLHGNQIEIAENYQTQLRGNMLNCLCNALNIEMTIVLRDVNGEEFIESYGQITNPLKIGIKNQQQKYICEVIFDRIVPKLQQNNSSHHINYIQRSRKDLQPADSTTEDMTNNKTKTESKSVNKDHLGRCKTCGSRARFCECDRRKGATPRLVQKNNIFDGLNFDNAGKTAKKQQNRRQCYCNRINCVCRK